MGCDITNFYSNIPAIKPDCDDFLKWDGENWTLYSPLFVRFDYKGKRYALSVCAGFKTDGGSVPRVFWRVVGHPFGYKLIAYLVHDALYGAELVTRSEADTILLELLQFIGCNWADRNAVYSAVCVGGGAVWKQHTPESVVRAREYCELTVTDKE